jgi:hypothetical protein
MNQQKRFYEIPLPKRHSYIVVVKVDDTPDETADCMEPGCLPSRGKREEDSDLYSVYQCEVCAQWFCFEHINKCGLCALCDALPGAMRLKVVAFREELNSL